MSNQRRVPRVLGGILGALAALGALGRADAGDLSGTVRLVGTPPPPAVIRLATDQDVCGPEPARSSDALVVSPSGGVKSAVVFIGHERRLSWRSPTTAQIDQRRCTFVPRVTIVPPGSTVEVLNSDGILHNFHTSGVAHQVNLAQPAFVKRLRITFDEPEIVPVKCDLHGEGFMRAWVVVARHPYYALTDDEGRFRLPDLPVGPHVLEVWHEVLGTKRIPITVGGSGTVQVTVTFDQAQAEKRP